MTGSASFDFAGKTVFVSGGSSGINLGIAHGFARAGADVAVFSRSQEKIDAAVAELQAHGGKVLGFTGDVRQFDQIEAALKGTYDGLGSIDVLVSGAAGNFLAPALGLSPNGFKTVVDIDLNGTFHVMRAAHQYLTKPGASVINISAPQAFRTMPFQIHACAAKAGVDQVTRVLAVEWAADGIRVNSISPGPIADTEGMARLAPTPEATETAKKSVPLGRFGTKDECAAAAMFLSSEQAAYISGVVLPVDGAQSLLGSNMAERMAQSGN
jgi:NAD(P)-dependent dehydrogenase (short-subunit alcohol dehydrogenase family)